MGRPEVGYLARRIELLKQFGDVFGETKYVSESEAREADPSLVWHVKTEEDSCGWLNGLTTSAESVDYWLASQPWTGQPESIYVVTDEFFDCPECEGGSVSDPDECDECGGYGCIVVDYEGVLYENPAIQSEDEIWEMRESQ
jgi:hypothetical protein